MIVPVYVLGRMCDKLELLYFDTVALIAPKQ